MRKNPPFLEGLGILTIIPAFSKENNEIRHLLALTNYL
jgi:hypothetical protein